ncbi:MAG: hypothetical protein IJM54_10290 [Thermoguttaceae bacterium]|nr:hypothetical protein [Thermoguttaceae bacterium]MBR4751561.1 hypothetical protein [Thermoguttaceae bacterium]
MSVFNALFSQLKTEDKAALQSALGWLVVIERGLKQSPSERLDEYDSNRAVGSIDTTDFTRDDFERLSQIERKYGKA